MYTAFLSFLVLGFFFLIGYILYLGLSGSQKLILIMKKTPSTKFNNILKSLYQKKINIALVGTLIGGVITVFLSGEGNGGFNLFPFYFFIFYVLVYLILPVLERNAMIKIKDEIEVKDIENIMFEKRKNNVKLIKSDIENLIGRKLTFLENNAFQRWYEK
jgi:hypothetical protein